MPRDGAVTFEAFREWYSEGEHGSEAAVASPRASSRRVATEDSQGASISTAAVCAATALDAFSLAEVVVVFERAAIECGLEQKLDRDAFHSAFALIRALADDRGAR